MCNSTRCPRCRSPPGSQAPPPRPAEPLEATEAAAKHCAHYVLH